MRRSPRESWRPRFASSEWKPAEATRVADGLTAAANKSFNSVESLGEALKYAGPVAADANMSLEETLAILGSLGNMGIQGSPPVPHCVDC